MNITNRKPSVLALMRFIRAVGFLLVAVIGFGLSPALAYTVVQISTSAPSGTETSFLAATTAQWMANLSENPLVSDTYLLTLFGPNPTFNPPPNPQAIFNASIAISTQTYFYGYADGMNYQNNVAINMTTTLSNLCASATNFVLNNSTWPPAGATTWSTTSTWTQSYPWSSASESWTSISSNTAVSTGTTVYSQTGKSIWTLTSTGTYSNNGNVFSVATCKDVLGTLIDQFFQVNLSTPNPIPSSDQ